MNILIPNLILLKELKQYDVYHENLKSSKILKGYDGVYKLCGTVTGPPFLDTLIEFQAEKAIAKKEKRHFSFTTDQKIFDDNYKNLYPYFSPEKSEAWSSAIPRKLTNETKAKSEVYSMGLILLEAGNLIQDVVNVFLVPKNLSKEI